MKRNILIVTPDRNSAKKRDFSGAFLPEAMAFGARHGVDLKTSHLRVDLGATELARQKQLLAAIDAWRVAFFCHGLKRRLPQLGWNADKLGELSAKLAKRSLENVRVVLYACSAGEGSGPPSTTASPIGSATPCARAARRPARSMRTRRPLTPRGTPPFVRRFEGLGSSVDGPGGYFLVTPGSGRWGLWREKLRTPFRFEFPFLSAAEIQTTL